MSRFELWSPHAKRVDLVLEDGERRMSMTRRDGWWEVEVDGAPAGTLYQFAIDGGYPVPDPRSPSQPKGIHGPSQTVDHSTFVWTDGGWDGFALSSSVLYEIHIGTFTESGTFDGAIKKLDYLAHLGVDAIELLPPVEFAGNRGWGYDGVDLYAPHHGYGGPGGLKRLIDAAHGKGIAVIIDVVYNHLGPDGNYLSICGPYFTSKYHTPWGDAVNYDDHGSNGVRAWAKDNVRMWLRDYHADGLRLDAVHAIFDASAIHILEEIALTVREIGNERGYPLALIAESNANNTCLVRSPQLGGYGFDAQWSDDFHHALHVTLTGDRSGYFADFNGLDDVETALGQTFVYSGKYSVVRGCNVGRDAGAVEATRFIGCMQNHDQIGNRAMGERSSALMGHERLKVAGALVLLSPFVPMLFQGEEWGATTPFLYFTDHHSWLGRQVSDGRRSEFADFAWEPDQIPDPQRKETFLASRLNWNEPADPAHGELLEWHRSLIALRRDHRILRSGRTDFEVKSDGDVIRMRRGPFTIIANIGDKAVMKSGYPTAKVLLASTRSIDLEQGVLKLPPDGVCVLREG